MYLWKWLLLIGSRHPKYLAPEILPVDAAQLADGSRTSDENRVLTQPSYGPKADVWSLGIILLELCLVGAVATPS